MCIRDSPRHSCFQGNRQQRGLEARGRRCRDPHRPLRRRRWRLRNEAWRSRLRTSRPPYFGVSRSGSAKRCFIEPATHGGGHRARNLRHHKSPMTRREASQSSAERNATVIRKVATARTSGAPYQIFVGPDSRLGWFGICPRIPGSSETRKQTACMISLPPVSYTHLRAHETGRNLVCRLLLEKKKN